MWGEHLVLINIFRPDSAPAVGNQVVPVQRGDLTIDISAAGNLALSITDNLAFDISGIVEEILVEEGDSVEEGQLLVKLDTCSVLNRNRPIMDIYLIGQWDDGSADYLYKMS